MPRPTEPTSPSAHTPVITKPVGKNASFVPGRTNGAASATAADAEAWATALLVVVVVCAAKTPFTKDASSDERVVLTRRLVMGDVAASSILGISRVRSSSLLIMHPRLVTVRKRNGRVHEGWMDWAGVGRGA